MATINQLSSSDEIQTGDQAPIWSADNGDTRRVNYGQVRDFVLEPLASSGDGEGSALVSFKQGGFGAVGRLALDKMRERVSFLDFGAKIDGSTDDTTAAQRTIDYLSSIGGGEAILPVGTGPMVITDTLRISHSGVRIISQAVDDFHVYAPDWSNIVNVSTAGAILWRGVNGGTMIDISPEETSPGVWNDNGGGIGGNGVHAILFAGEFPFASVAAIGVKASASSSGDYWVMGVEFSEAAMKGCALARSGTDFQNSFTWNNIQYVGFRNISTAGGGLKLDGLASFGGNAFQNVVNIITGIYSTGTALDLAACDNNLLRQVRMQRISGGTGTGVIFRAGDDASLRSNLNTIDLLSAGGGGVVCEGTASGAFPSISNRILNYNPDENGVPATPTIEDGATLFYNNGHRSGGGSFTARPASDQTIAPLASTKVNFGTSVSNYDGWYDATNSRFQPKFPGRYLLSVRIWATIATAGGNVTLTLTPNAGAVSFAQFQDTTPAGNYSFAVEGMFDMNGTTDYVDVRLIHANASDLIVKQGTNQSHFMASRLA